jgi:hypothetical protein
VKRGSRHGRSGGSASRSRGVRQDRLREMLLLEMLLLEMLLLEDACPYLTMARP